LLVHTPAVFVRVANKEVTGYGTWKSVRKMEDGAFGNAAEREKSLGWKEATRQFVQERNLKELRASRFVSEGNKGSCGDGIFVT
jgi:hypothetical protein